MLKILPTIPSRTSQNFDRLFMFYSPIPVFFIVLVIIMSTIHTVTIILVNRILPVQAFLQNLHEILLPAWTSSPSSSFQTIIEIISLHIPIVTSNYSCIMLVNVL